ncbi:xanthine dehydrogenase family protein molybdopterin-binding subunit [Klebsiella pneumoniae]|uniref:xanthine dehydrogenase family protein molybdopterin-binding subunit n=1 Tax=Klebsiella pneumoniae TaxID=573 RepID=UPI0010915BD1|nr:xanthine dehydrogenase family protein molybdopterin-binding subunit [Klebsiella pneumoniae]MBK2735351.1 xanthine dehydrogenase family protein molybdopterin-binding subunit [Klebsiella pneumoniae]VGB99722.1 xanthine dehydrogenase [Klebsiella pneumoniae]
MKWSRIGPGVSRLDGAQKVRGEARFAAEFPIENMVFAALVFSTIAKGRIAELDASVAEAAPGVVLVMTYRNAPRLHSTPALLTSEKASGGNCLAVLQDDRIHWNGQPIAVVLAETQEQADYAATLVKARFEPELAITAFEDAKAAGTEIGSHMGEELRTVVGDAPARLQEAAFKVDALYTTPGHNHNAIELHGVTVAWEGERLRIHDASQSVTHTAWSVAQVFGLDESHVHVTSPFVGGGFGSKLLWEHHIFAAAASRLAKRPVRLVLTREGVYRIVGGRAMTEQRMAIGANADGAFEAIIHTGTVAMTRHNIMAEPFTLGTAAAYASKSLLLEVRAAKRDMVANTYMRGPGEAVGTFALESAIDELAHEMGIDPIELRLRNDPDRHPVKGTPFSSRHFKQVYRDGAERFGWGERRAPGTRRQGEWLVGLGCATTAYPYVRMPGGAARITLCRRGTAHVDVAAHEMGMGTATVQTQIAADLLGVPIADVRFTYGDSTLPGLILAAASQQTAAVAAAVEAARDALVAELLAIAGKGSPLAGLSVDQIVARDGGLFGRDDPALAESYTSILSRAGRDQLRVEAAAPPSDEAEDWAMYSCGAMFTEVRVNAVTGEVRIARFLGSFDCGRILNAKTATSQFRGGIIMGLGLALMEETQFDERSGRIMNPSLAEYHMPAHLDVPPIEIMWTDIPDPQAPMGARGIGEIGITGVAAAVANAIFNATGKRIRDLPITLDKVL